MKWCNFQHLKKKPSGFPGTEKSIPEIKNLSEDSKSRTEQKKREFTDLHTSQEKISSKLKHREKTVINQRVWNMWDGAKLSHIHVSAISDKETK